MDKEQEKYQIVSRLLNDEAPELIAADLDVSINKVRRLKREFKKAQDDNTVQEFINLDEAMLNELMDIAKEKVPEAIAEDAGEALVLLKGQHSLMDALSTDLQTTAKFLSNRIKSTASTVQHASELEVLADALCKLQTAFFNSNTTQVNVQNNYGDQAGSPYGDLLSDKPQNH
jgi:DNA-binding GntR family transcriptional regulator